MFTIRAFNGLSDLLIQSCPDRIKCKAELDHEFLPLLRVYKDGHVERLYHTETIPASIDPSTCVSSKDVVIIPESNVSARLYLPSLTDTHQKLPLVIYFHGGGFCIGSASSLIYHQYLNSLVSESNVIVVSVDYRLAPEHPLPIAYEDSWAALQWVAVHSKGIGSETWLTNHTDFNRVYLAGVSAGANIVHNLALRAGEPDNELGMKLLGIALVHPYFWGSKPVGSEAMDPSRKALVDRLWPYVCPSMPDNDDPRVNPMAAGAPSLVNLGCTRVLVCVAEKDVLRDRGWLYYETLGKCGWEGIVEIIETKGEDHAFHISNPTCENAKNLIKRLATFFNCNDSLLF